jgi:hypothetical protein
VRSLSNGKIVLIPTYVINSNFGGEKMSFAQLEKVLKYDIAQASEVEALYTELKLVR